MQAKIQLNDEVVPYTLKVSRRARRMRLTVYCNGNFVVTVPHGFDTTSAENFISRKADWVLRKLAHFKAYGGELLSARTDTRREFAEHKERALALVRERVAYFNAGYGYGVKGVAIKNQKTRWGSCSRAGNLNFNYKIALLPAELADYLVVHEICHLREFNHSKRFWALVAKALPNFAELRKDLARHLLNA